MLDLINPECAARTIAQLTAGCDAFVTYDGQQRYYKVVSWTPYSVTFEVGNNTVALPVTALDLYNEELATMGLAPLPVSPGAARRGRPPKPQGTQAPANATRATQQAATTGDQPFDPGAWGGPSGGTLAADVATAEAAIVQPATTTKPATPQPKQVTIEEAEGNANWATDSVDEALAALRDHLIVITDRLSATVVKPQPEAKKTCADCINSLMSVNLCGKFNVQPPMSVICDAQTMCQDFVDIGLDTEIPF